MKKNLFYIFLFIANFFATKSFAQKIDSIPPIIGPAGANATISCPSTPSFTAPTASDAQGGVIVSTTGPDVTGGTACKRAVTRTWVAVDSAGNHSAIVSQTITIIDNTPPTIGNARADATIECTASLSFTAPTASDACNGTTVSTVGPDVTIGTSCSRTVTRTWRAVDACGNSSATRSQTITIRDSQAPTIGSAGANATIACTATPSFTAPSAFDACGPVTVNILSDVIVRISANSYTETRTWGAIDACSNHSATVSQAITVIDTQPPIIGQVGADATVESSATPLFTAPTASDACGPVTVNLLSDMISDLTGVGAIANSYRETKTWDAVDAGGNHSGAVSQTITVIDNGGIIQPDGNSARRSANRDEITSTSIRVYPNPSYNKFRVDLFTKTAKPVQIDLYDQSGHLLQRKEIYCTAGTGSTLWDMSRYAAGVYFIKIENLGLKNIKIIKQ
ncbi:MAG TPA: T9SS type A sorting domain-containing protein [Chitinophagaceae bacterium]|nr:T9SS type A sorting domain-containing protein [Chitinophagaceae bacterium]